MGSAVTADRWNRTEREEREHRSSTLSAWRSLLASTMSPSYDGSIVYLNLSPIKDSPNVVLRALFFLTHLFFCLKKKFGGFPKF